ncbi:response regulator [Alteromonas sediminis]|uniref:Response regulator n=1 Tax=Alteromonas sediminis TaxID=2259342 RepID=A0A3N5Z960_9ALTE|nr:response regulator [Alteromonas sediminis]RPJ65678.1 response regulator [Alteromonas sediminis]
MASVDKTEGHLFLVEDDPSLAALVTEYFEMQGFKVSVESRGDTALARILTENVDLVILDLMLPGKNGLDVCRELRSESKDIPVVMLTARTDDIDQIVGLEVGADDYICKPVQPRLLLARVNALLRRAHSTESANTNDGAKPESQTRQFGSLFIDMRKQQVVLNNNEVEMTTNEMALLWQFAQNADTVLSRDALLNQLRGFGYDGLDRTVDMLVSRLRKKLGDSAEKPERIKTVWKKGYLFVADAW